jgi:hypothetical protein
VPSTIQPGSIGAGASATVDGSAITIECDMDKLRIFRDFASLSP